MPLQRRYGSLGKGANRAFETLAPYPDPNGSENGTIPIQFTVKRGWNLRPENRTTENRRNTREIRRVALIGCLVSTLVVIIFKNLYACN